MLLRDTSVSGQTGYCLSDTGRGVPARATGAFLTDNIPGFDFDPTFVQDDDSTTCPIEHFGNFK